MSDDERASLEEQLPRAHALGMSVVAAGGNGGGALELPGNVRGVLPIAAGGTSDGALCSYASYASDVLVGPGCGVSISWLGVPVISNGGGSSSAAVTASVLLALLRTLRPGASRDDAERWLRDGARNVGGRPILDAERAARAAGLASLVDRARARMPQPEPPSTPLQPVEERTPPAAISPTLGKRVERPSARVNWRRGRLTITIANPRATYVERLQVIVRGNGGVRRRQFDVTTRRKIKWRLRAEPRVVVLRNLPFEGDDIKASALVKLTARGTGVFR
jgi:hypothetical protein